MISRRRFLAASALGAAALLGGCATPTRPQLVCSTFPVGTGSYNDVAALAGTLTGRTGRPVRIMISGTSIGRLAPLINGTAHYARVGDEYLHAFEADDEFAAAGWGPQPVRQVWSPPGFYGVLVRADSGIRTTADLIGSTSMNRKLTAAFHNVVGAAVEEFAARHDIRWLDLRGGDAGVGKQWRERVPMVSPGLATAGAGITPENPVTVMTYTVPLVTLAARETAEVAALVTDIHRHHPHYRDATPDAHRFEISQLLTSPLVVPFHEGVIDLLTRHGRWSPAHTAQQEALLEREARLQDAWTVFRDSGWPPARWREWKNDRLPTRPTLEA